MKHIKTMIITVLLAGMLCTGCGAVGNIKDYSQTVSDSNGNTDNMAETEENNVKKETVNGTDGTYDNGNDVQKTEEKKCYWENDDNSYDVTYGDDDKRYLFQYSLDLKKVINEVEIKDIDEVVWVTNEWVYYTEEKNKDSLWRIPIKKTEKGDKLKVSEKEKLFSMEYICVDVYVTDTYIIFSGSEKENKRSSLYKYEIKDRKYTKLQNMDLDDGYIMYGEEFPYMIDGMLFVYDYDKIYQLNPDTGDAKKIYQSSDTSGELDEDYYIVSGGCLYFEDFGNNFYKYNVGDEKAKSLISSDSFEKVMEKLNLWGEKSKRICIGIYDYYIYNGQVYFAVRADWKEKDSKTFGKSVWVDYDYEVVLLSAPLDDITKLQCVDVVKKYIDNHTKWDMHESEQEYYAYKEIELYFVDGKMLLDMDDEESFAIYNLDTGKIKEISEKEWKEKYWD